MVDATPRGVLSERGIPDISIIIVNWNSAVPLRRCLTSILPEVGNLQIQVIVIDNASYDGAETVVATEFSGISYIQAELNTGFGAASNQAAATATGRYLLFLNPDTALLDDALTELLQVLETRADVGIVGPRTVNEEGRLQQSARRFPTLVSEVLPIHRWFKSRRMTRSDARGASQERYDIEVDWVSGACLMISRELFQQVGAFTREYFMYSEDVDLCWKVRQAGRRVSYVGNAVVMHSGGLSTGKRSTCFAEVLQRDSRYRFFRLRKGAGYARLYRAVMAIGAVARVSVLAGMWPISDVKRRPQIAAGIVKWWKITRWCIGKEEWASKLNDAIRV